jgi:hypothetical protein
MKDLRLVLFLAPALLLDAAAFTPPAAAQTTAQLMARCSQLMAYYDRFGVGRGIDHDGRRNHTRIDAEVDCRRGLYAEGIATLESLMRRKKFTPPPPGPNVGEDDD